MIDRFGMAIRPPAFLSDDVARSVFRPPWATMHAVARSRGVNPDTIFREIEPDVAGLARSLQARLASFGWPEEDVQRRLLVQESIYDQLGPLRNSAGVLGDFSSAARGKSLAWLYGPEAMSVLVRMAGRENARVNRVALSLYCQDLEGHDVVGSIVRRIDRPDMVTGIEGDGDVAASPVVTPAAPVVFLPRPSIPFASSSGATWAGAGPASAKADDPATLPRTNRWSDVSVSPPPSISGDGTGAVTIFLLALAVGAVLQS